MDTIVIKTATSYQARDTVIAYINAGFKASKAEIRYNLSKGLPPIEREDLYPLVLEGSFNGCPTSIKVYSVTVGYPGTGPNDLVSILKAAGFILFTPVLLTDAWSFNSEISITCFPEGKMYDNTGKSVLYCCKS